jgi:hypothetical protein
VGTTSYINSFCLERVVSMYSVQNLLAKAIVFRHTVLDFTVYSVFSGQLYNISTQLVKMEHSR